MASKAGFLEGFKEAIRGTGAGGAASSPEGSILKEGTTPPGRGGGMVAMAGGSESMAKCAGGQLSRTSPGGRGLSGRATPPAPVLVGAEDARQSSPSPVGSLTGSGSLLVAKGGGGRGAGTEEEVHAASPTSLSPAHTSRGNRVLKAASSQRYSRESVMLLQQHILSCFDVLKFMVSSWLHNRMNM